MKPFYDEDGITIWCGDNRRVLPMLEEFDLLLTDPPYGIGKKLHDGGTWSTNPIYDKMLEWDVKTPEPWVLQMVISKAKNAIEWGGNYYQLTPSRCWLSWNKTNSVRTMADIELAWTNFDANARKFDEMVNSDGKRVHPTQKPLSLMSWCLSHAPEARTVLDPWMGSGTTLVAAKARGLRAVGIEINEEYCKAAVERLRQGVLIPV
jgi:DNA modification methylase